MKHRASLIYRVMSSLHVHGLLSVTEYLIFLCYRLSCSRPQRISLSISLLLSLFLSIQLSTMSHNQDIQPLLSIGDCIENIWIVVSLIRCGVQAQVFKAVDSSGTGFAVKVQCDPNEHFLEQEHLIYKMICDMLPPGQYPKAYYLGSHNGHVLMVMDLLGETVGSLLTTQICPNSSTVLGWMGPLIEQIEALHSLGFVHRDVNMNNIISGRAETGMGQSLFLIDFGVALRYVDEDGSPVGSILRHCSRKIDLLGMLERPSEYIAHLHAEQGDAESLSILRKFQKAWRYVMSLQEEDEPDYDHLGLLLT